MHRTSAAGSRMPLVPSGAVRMLDAGGMPIASAPDFTLTRR